MARWGKRWRQLPGEAPSRAKRVGGRYAHATGGKRADLGGLYVRSNMEANYLRFLTFLGIPWQYEPVRFIFHAVVSGKNRVYVPDVYLPRAKEYHEIKGWMDKNSAIKLRRMAKFYPTVKVVVIGPEFFRDVCARRLCRAIPGYQCPHTRGST
jgi:hypothetical protein